VAAGILCQKPSASLTRKKMPQHASAAALPIFLANVD
jgi:hypothetical protein